MNFVCNSRVSSFYEFATDGFQSEMSDFRSMQGRLYCFKTLLQKILFLPFAILLKSFVTLFRGVGVVTGFALLVATFGTREGIVDFFSRRVLFLAQDLVDWVLFPFIVTLGVFKLLLGSAVHPAIYFR